MENGDRQVHKLVLANGTPVHVFRGATTGHPDRAVILFHERYGLVQHTLDLAARLAESGLLSVAPDLFEGKVDDYDAVREGRERAVLDDDQVVETAEECMALLRHDYSLYAPSVAVMGVCQSGRHPICVASASPEVGAVVVFYGAAQARDWDVSEEQPVAMTDMLQALEVPVFATFAEADHVISIDDVFRFRSALEQGRSSYLIRVQEDAPHGFMDSTKPGRYRQRATEESWTELMRFLEANLSDRPQERVGTRGSATWEFRAGISRSYDFSQNVRLE